MQTRQPWADVVAEPARPTAEQEEWLKAEGFREEPEEQPDEDAEDGAPKVSQQPKVPCRVCCWKGGFRLPIAHRQAIGNPHQMELMIHGLGCGHGSTSFK